MNRRAEQLAYGGLAMAVFAVFREMEVRASQKGQMFERYDFRPLPEPFVERLPPALRDVKAMGFFETHQLAPANLVLKNLIMEEQIAGHQEAVNYALRFEEEFGQTLPNFVPGESDSFENQAAVQDEPEAIEPSSAPLTSAMEQPSIEMNESGQLEIDMGPLDDVIQPLHDAVPPPINSAGTDLYNSIVMDDKNAGQQ